MRIVQVPSSETTDSWSLHVEREEGSGSGAWSQLDVDIRKNCSKHFSATNSNIIGSLWDIWNSSKAKHRTVKVSKEATVQLSYVKANGKFTIPLPPHPPNTLLHWQSHSTSKCTIVHAAHFLWLQVELEGWKTSMRGVDDISQEINGTSHTCKGKKTSASFYNIMW